jgi:hypothetical protein
VTPGRHRRDGQRRDALRARLRSLRAILSPRRLGAAGGATAIPPGGAPEAPAPSGAPVRQQRAGASPQLPRPGDPPRRGDAPWSGPGQQPPDAAPGEVTAPASPGAAARPPWVTWHGPPGTPPPPAYRGDYRPTQPFRAVTGTVRAPYVAAHEARRDAPAVIL